METKILEKNPYKGQLKLSMSGGEWNLEKLDEKVCVNMCWQMFKVKVIVLLRSDQLLKCLFHWPFYQGHSQGVASGGGLPPMVKISLVKILNPEGF